MDYISEVTPAIQVTFFLLVRIFPLNFSFYLNYYKYPFFSFLGKKYFLRTQIFSWTNGPVVRYFFHTYSDPVLVLNLRPVFCATEFQNPYIFLLFTFIISPKRRFAIVYFFLTSVNCSLSPRLKAWNCKFVY